MLRAEVNQALLDLFTDASYLEIGVQAGHTFHALRAADKTAVDPHFIFDVRAARADPANKACRYFEVTSDVYFSDIQERGKKYNMVFVDGLHTFDQTLKDLLNAVCCLKDDGIIVVDDVMPSSYQASIPEIDLFESFASAVGSTDGSWMGDVFKVVFFIQEYLPLFRYATVLENHGQMVMWQAPRPASAQSIEKVKAVCDLEYCDFILRRSALNLLPFSDILNHVKTDCGAAK